MPWLRNDYLLPDQGLAAGVVLTLDFDALFDFRVIRRCQQTDVWLGACGSADGRAVLLQSVLSFNPVLSDIRLEGILVFDCGDGLWRNEIASHLIHGAASGTWFDVTTEFSGFGDHLRMPKMICSFRTYCDPRFGFNVLKAVATDSVGDYEDLSLVFDSATNLWSLALCVNNGNGYPGISRPNWMYGAVYFYHAIPAD